MEDYIKNGLMYCGKCNTPKEQLVTVQNPVIKLTVKYRVPTFCKCAKVAHEKEMQQIKTEQAIKKIENLRTASLMDKKFLTQTFENAKGTADNADNIVTCKRYVEHFDTMQEKGCGLILSGEVGTGKTYAAACIANALLDKGVPVIMTSFVKILESVMRDYKTESELLDTFDGADLLILDDLGAERNTDFALEKIYNVIDRRYRTQKPMIVTTNLPIKTLKNESDTRYKRIYDRLIETCVPLKFEGGSIRKAHPISRDKQINELLRGFGNTNK